MCDLSIAFQPISQKSSTNCAIEDSFTNTCYNYEKEKNKKISHVIEKIIPELEDKKQGKKKKSLILIRRIVSITICLSNGQTVIY